MDPQSKTYWVVPFLDDVAAFLAENGMQESSGIVAEAAAKVQRCSRKEEPSTTSGGGAQVPGVGNVVHFNAAARAPRRS